MEKRTPAGTAARNRMTSPRILLVRFSAIGDCVMATWAATAIRQKYPDGFLVWAVEGRCAPVIDRHRLVTQRYEFPRDRWKQKKWSPATWQQQLSKYVRLRALRFDLGLDLQGHSKTALCLRIASPKKRISAAATDRFASCLNPLATGRTADMHTVEWNHAVLNHLEPFEFAERPTLPDVGAVRQPNLVSISVGAGHPSKIYPRIHWERIARDLIAKGFRVVALGGKNDEPLEVDGIENQVGKLRLKESLRVVAESALHLAGDTGTGHMAAAVGTPVVSIFGPMDPVLYRPYTKSGTDLLRDADPKKVSPEEVLEAAAHYLSGGGA